MRKLISSRVISALDGKSKSKRTLEILGCTADKFRQYLESMFSPEMNWQNHGEVWEIDHI
jgi:acyl-CoA hydrolase